MINSLRENNFLWVLLQYSKNICSFTQEDFLIAKDIVRILIIFVIFGNNEKEVQTLLDVVYVFLIFLSNNLFFTANIDLFECRTRKIKGIYFDGKKNRNENSIFINCFHSLHYFFVFNNNFLFIAQKLDGC